MIKTLLKKLKKKRVRYICIAVVIAIIIGIIALCRSCSSGTVSKRLYEDFTQEEIDSWGNAKDEYAMHGGYYIHFGGVDYPVVFDNGEIVKFDNSPEELAFISMDRLYYDSGLSKVCCYYGYRYKQVLFWEKKGSGYVLEDKRPAIGTILYLDETKQIKIKIRDNFYLPDEEIAEVDGIGPGLYSVRGVALCYGYAEDVNTCRKIYNFLKDTETSEECRYYGYKSLPSVFESNWTDEDEYLYDDTWYGSLDIIGAYDYRSSRCEHYAVLTPVRIALLATDTVITLHYDNAQFADEYVRYTKNPLTLDSIEGKTDYSEIKTDSEGNVTEYKNGDGKTIRVVHSVADIPQRLVDYANHKAVSFFNRDSEHRYKIDSSSDISLFYNNWYAVWEDCKILSLHSSEDTGLAVFQDKATVLPTDLKEPGYEFEGWYTDENFGGDKITSVSYNDGITNVYAKFNKVDHYTLTFEPYDGKTFDDITYSYGEAKFLPVLTKAFHIFKGWCTDEECKTTPIKSIESDFYGNYRLYACFEPRKYTVTIKDGDTVKDILVSYGEEFVLPFEEKESKFIGYFDIDGNRYTDENGKSLSPFTDGADINLFAKYEEA